MIHRHHVICLSLLVAVRASAQPAGAQAEELFRQGRTLIDSGKTAEACTAFEESERLEAATTTLLNLAGCREKLGQIATAWGLFLQAERETRGASDAATRQLHDIAKDRAAKLEPRVSKLAIDVAQPSRVDGLEITRGKDRVDAATWGQALPVDGGTYEITAKAPGRKSWSTQVTVGAERDSKSVEVPPLEKESAAPQPVPQPAPTAPVTVAPAQPSHVVPIVTAIGAVALLGGAYGLSRWGDSTYDDAKAETTSQARRDSLYASANHKRYAAEGVAVAGIACAGVALWLLLRHDDRDEHAITLAPAADAHGGGLTLSGRY